MWTYYIYMVFVHTHLFHFISNRCTVCTSILWITWLFLYYATEDRAYDSQLDSNLTSFLCEFRDFLSSGSSRTALDLWTSMARGGGDDSLQPLWHNGPVVVWCRCDVVGHGGFDFQCRRIFDVVFLQYSHGWWKWYSWRKVNVFGLEVFTTGDWQSTTI